MTTIKPLNKRHRPDHLKPFQFKPGNNANPKGRPKSPFTISDVVRKKLKEIDPKTGKSYAELIGESMVMNALKSPEVLKQVLERVEGKVTENIDMRAVGVNILYELVKPREQKSIEQSEGSLLKEGEKE